MLYISALKDSLFLKHLPSAAYCRCHLSNISAKQKLCFHSDFQMNDYALGRRRGVRISHPGLKPGLLSLPRSSSSSTTASLGRVGVYSCRVRGCGVHRPSPRRPERPLQGKPCACFKQRLFPIRRWVSKGRERPPFGRFKGVRGEIEIPPAAFPLGMQNPVCFGGTKEMGFWKNVPCWVQIK